MIRETLNNWTRKN